MKSRKKKTRPFLRSEIAVYIVFGSIASFFRKLYMALVPAAQRTLPVRALVAVITLEGPRLMLISRYRAAQMERAKKVGISAISGTAIASIIVATILIGSQIIAVTVDGQVIGVVESEEQYAALLQNAKDKVSEQIGAENAEIMIQDTSVSLETVLGPQAAAAVSDTLDEGEAAADENGNGSGDATGTLTPPTTDEDVEAFVDTLIDTLMTEGAIKATLYSINVNGEAVAQLSTMKEASDVLNAVAQAYAPAEGEYVGKFLDDVTIDGVTADLEDASPDSVADVVALLLDGAQVQRSYTAFEDDSIGTICKELDVSERTLRETYSDYDFKEIQEGDAFTVAIKVPLLSYTTEGKEATIEPIQFETIEELTSDMYLGKREVKEEGELGERAVSRFVTRVNGVVVAEVEMGSEVVKEAKPEVMLVGTTVVGGGDAYVGPSDGWGGGGDGPLGRPLDSWALSRSVGGGHNGADMLAPRGAPIYAAEYGTVSFSGVYGGYGNLVIIDHGNGLQTYYAHCDTLNVSVGTVVSRGQQIATVGSTGRSSAYHLHFEVRVNGEVQEPLRWIG